jgi:hypothetical protein
MATKRDSEGLVLQAMQCPITELYQAEGNSIACDPRLLDNMERKERANIWKMREDHDVCCEQDKVWGGRLDTSRQQNPRHISCWYN